MLDSLEYRVAKGRIESYEHSADEISRASEEAQECLECEDLLQKGIKACEALEILEIVVRDAVAEGHLQPTPEVKSLIHALFAEWLQQSQRAAKWIDRQIEKGYDLKHLAEFRESCGRVEEWLDRQDWLTRAATTRRKFAEELW
ncbi:MAG TPA: hypothetical protein VMP01_11510 [Pirellulaceae bacterium]|nr:hypothetical protein [Pirellulaceae bacterium]